MNTYTKSKTQNATPAGSTNNENESELTKAGYHKKKDVIGLFTEEQTTIIDGAQERMNAAFYNLVVEKGWSNARTLDEFFPYISGPSAVSRMLSGRQNVNLDVILAMALRFGHSLDEILLGRKQSGYILTPEDIRYFYDLLKKASQCSGSKK